MAWLAENPGAGGNTAARRAAWLAEYPELTAGGALPFAAITEDALWGALRAVPLRDFFDSPWYQEAAPAFAPRYDELRRRWEAEG